MSIQMYTDLIVKDLTKSSALEPTAFSFALVGTLSGTDVQIDALPTPVPLSEFDFLVDDTSSAQPVYKNGDRLFIVPANDGKQLVIVGRLI